MERKETNAFVGKGQQIQGMCAFKEFDRNESQVIFKWPHDEILTGRKKANDFCSFMVMVHFLRIKCGSSNPYGIQVPVLKARDRYDQDIIHFTLSCDNVTNSNCNPELTGRSPECRFEPNVSVNTKDGVWESLENLTRSDLAKSQNVSAIISWTLTTTDQSAAELSTDDQIKYYVVRFGQGSRLFDKSVPVLRAMKLNQYVEFTSNVTLIQTTENWTRIDGLKVGELYGIQVCGIYSEHRLPDFSDENPKTRPQTIKIEINEIQSSLKSDGSSNRTTKSGSAEISYMIGVPLFAALLITILAIIIIFRRSKRQRKQIDSLQSSLKNNTKRGKDVEEKRDLYEIDRRQVVCYDDQQLGSGAFGTVYKGKIVGTLKCSDPGVMASKIMAAENPDVAIKMLPEYADEISTTQFLREIHIMKQIGSHSRIVSLMACSTQSQPYLCILEYCSDGDLLHYLRKRRDHMIKLNEMDINYYQDSESAADIDRSMLISFKELISFALQVCQGLDYLGTNGFIHRDLAARNVLVHEGRYVKIGDFGLTRQGGEDNEGAYFGTGGRLPVKWMAPESITHCKFSHQSDIWSFGIVLFEIVTLGGTPYPGIQPADMESHLEEGHRLEQPDNCPESIYEIMTNCWEFKPDFRTSMKTVQSSLSQLLEEVTVDYDYLDLSNRHGYYNLDEESQEKKEEDEET